jgi:hypothetical protein
MAIDYKKLYSELGGVGNVSPELAYEARGLEKAKGSLFDASSPLAFDNAQNTAQKAKDKSDELQEAYKAASAGDFAQMPKFDTYHKSEEQILEAGGYVPEPDPGPMAKVSYRWENGRFVSEAQEYTKRDAALRRNAIATATGKKINPADDALLGIHRGMMFGMPGMGGGGGYRLSEDQMKRQQQTPTSNVAPYGFDKDGNRIVQSNLMKMPQGGLPVSPYEYKSQLSLQDQPKAFETPMEQPGVKIPDQYKNLMEPPKTQ